ncbi:MAG: hypothetical protein M0Q47_13380 [Methanothrix sp.]|jgi:hypothetical protein|uniref:hypothetical protein n=1 Tax=Methanothrix sp. TaxID=90426 RepID=UPI0025D59B3D|nr:hypothetical protein [Methanothrix sp.]MCK9407384.1 hypothetical protein [Methanothrix sp.]
MKVKDDEVAFLRGHIAQLTQSISQLSIKARRDGGNSEGGDKDGCQFNSTVAANAIQSEYSEYITDAAGDLALSVAMAARWAEQNPWIDPWMPPENVSIYDDGAYTSPF